MGDVSQILINLRDGERDTEELFSHVYDELRRIAASRLARERADHTLQPTALVHEAFVKLVNGNAATDWECRSHFVNAAAEAMRRILIDHARARNAEKRGGGAAVLSLDVEPEDTESSNVDILAINDALTKLEAQEPDMAQLVKLRYFAGLSLEEVAKAMGTSRATVSRHWQYCRAWLFAELT